MMIKRSMSTAGTNPAPRRMQQRRMQQQQQQMQQQQMQQRRVQQQQMQQQQMQQQQMQQQSASPAINISELAALSKLPGMPSVPSNVDELKLLLQQFGPMLSEQNRGFITELITQLEQGGDKSSLLQLAQRMQGATPKG